MSEHETGRDDGQATTPLSRLMGGVGCAEAARGMAAFIETWKACSGSSSLRDAVEAVTADKGGA